MTKELQDIVATYDRLNAAGQSCALATVVHVEGSAYRRAGARMLVDELGNMTGAISGGCLEGDALEKALLAIHQQQNKLVTYDTSAEADAVIGAQLGCEGIIRVLFEPVKTQEPLNPIELLRSITKQQTGMVLVTLFNLNRTAAQPGTLLLMGNDIELSPLPAELASIRLLLQYHIEECFREEAPMFKQYIAGNTTVCGFFSYLPAAKQLVIVGAGQDGQILAQLAAALDWRVTVVDGRMSHARKERFPPSCSVIVSRPDQFLDRMLIDSRTCIVLMTHNYQYDLAVLTNLLQEPETPYIGILGPAKKRERMLDELRQQGVTIDAGQLDKLYAPVGLEIGAETSAEIALAILAELQAVLTGTAAGFLRDKTERIHAGETSRFERIEL